MKKFLSLVLALVMTMSLVTVSAGAKTFKDDDSINYKEAVEVMKAIKVIDGYADGKFNPTNVLTRQAAAKIICNLVLGPTTADALVATENPYPDVPTTSQFAGYIAYCKQTGIISGYADGNFQPTGTLTGYAFMKMLLGALGYDQTVEGYVGENWKVNVAKRALNLGLDKDLIGAFNGNKSVNREEACLYALNMIQKNMVEYGQHGVATAKKTGETFMEVYFKDLKKSKDIDRDAWGRPSVSNFKLKKDQIAYVALKPVAEYNVATTECDICKDLNEKKEAVMDVTWKNGVADKKDVTLTALATKNKIGAQGQIVEIYEYDFDLNDKTDDTYEMVIVDTYLAQVKDVTEVKTDANGHIKKQATLKLDVFMIVDRDAIAATVTLKSDDNFEYDEDDYVLFHMNEKDIQDSEVIKVVEPETMKYTGISTKAFTEIKLDGTWEKFACKYAYDFDAIEDDFCKIDVFFDQFGNVIGTLEIDAVKTVAVIDEMHTDTVHGKSTFMADIVGTDAKMDEYEIDEIYFEGLGTLDVDDIDEKDSVNKKKLPLAYDKLFTYTADEDGVLSLEAITDSTIDTDAYTEVTYKYRELYTDKGYVKFNDNTTFLIHENDGSYTSVKGDEIGDIRADHVEYTVKSGYADVVYLYGNIFRADDVAKVYVPVQEVHKLVNQKVDGETVKVMKVEYTTVDGDSDIAYMPVPMIEEIWQAFGIEEGINYEDGKFGGFFMNASFFKDTKVLNDKRWELFGYEIDEVEGVKANTVVLDGDAISLPKIDNIYVIEDGEISKGDASDVKKGTYAHVFWAAEDSKYVVDELYIDLDLTAWYEEVLENAKQDAIKELKAAAAKLVEENDAVSAKDLEDTLQDGIDAIDEAEDKSAVEEALTAAKEELEKAAKEIQDAADEEAATALAAEMDSVEKTITLKNVQKDTTPSEIKAVIAAAAKSTNVEVDLTAETATVDDVVYKLVIEAAQA